MGLQQEYDVKFWLLSLKKVIFASCKISKYNEEQTNWPWGWKDVYARSRSRSVKHNIIPFKYGTETQNFRDGGTLAFGFINEKPETQRHKVTWPRQSQDTC